jgi:hypothetical protein
MSVTVYLQLLETGFSATQVLFILQLRNHLNHLYKHQNQQRAININNPETQYMHLETRLVQLDSAIQMELWQVI